MVEGSKPTSIKLTPAPMNKETEASRLTALPPEVILQILYGLDIPSVARLRAVSHYLCRLIDEDPATQYQIRLFLADKKDGFPGPRPKDVLERSTALGRYRECWSNSEWSWSHSLTMTSEDHVWELAGGVFGIVRENHSESSPRLFEFVQFPSRIRNLELKNWTLPARRQMKDFTMDPSQDLLITVFISETSGGLGIACEHMSDGAPHRSASTAVGFPDLKLRDAEDLDELDVNMQICRDLLGVFLSPGNGDDDFEFFVWNWRTGRTIMFLSDETAVHKVHSFCFLSEEYVVTTSMKTISVGTGSAPTILVHDIRQPKSKPVAFCLPLIENKDTDCIESISVYTDCTPHPDYRTASPFTSSHRDRLIIISFVMDKFGYEDMSDSADTDQQGLFCVPASTFLKSLGKDMGTQDSKAFSDFRKIHFWNEWGPNGCKTINLPYFSVSSVWTCIVQGMRLICSSAEGGSSHYTIFDFGTTSSSSDVVPISKEHHIAALEEMEKTDDWIFRGFPVKTFLPATTDFGQVYSPLQNPDDFEEFWMLSEDGVVQVREFDDETCFKFVTV